FDPPEFILKGIPGLEAAHIWISIPFSMFYIISLTGNFTVLFVVDKEETLHKPMYLLFCMLAITDIGISTCVMPKALSIFWFGFKSITVDGCLTQIFFLYFLTSMHSAVLVAMAFDRYVAICDPLRYTTILTNARIIKLGLVCLIRAVLLLLPGPLLLRRLPFCSNRIIPHTYCEHNAVLKMSCGDTRVFQMYSLVLTFMIIGLDLIFIGLSYGLIIRAILRISSKKAHQKTLNTCTAHICVMLMFYTPNLFSTLRHRFGQDIASHVHILLANVYLLVPPMFNPIIYGVNTREFLEKVCEEFKFFPLVGVYVSLIDIERHLPSRFSFTRLGTLSISDLDRRLNHLMADFNLTPPGPSTFILKGIPGLEGAHIWISIPFSMFYIIILLGNLTVLFIVSKEQTLQKPMYLLLCMLALTDRLPFCSNHVISHMYCDYMAVVKISCGDTTVNRMYNFVITLVIIGLDLTLIGLSYGLIIRAVLRIDSKKALRKALNTCTAHICTTNSDDFSYALRPIFHQDGC
ncbi:olfactory receptor 52P1-like, partial [Emydura macquarii macquarii]|uniref:olfactory receptor 52P1-like n=1 Tax=Emydura macquarii macquarii TaxID=1129001 RepID=UPI00352BB891